MLNHEELRATIGQELRRRRRDLGLTLQELGDKTGISKQTLSRYETGFIYNIPFHRLEAIAQVLGTTLSALLGYVERGNIAMTNEEQRKIALEFIKTATERIGSSIGVNETQVNCCAVVSAIDLLRNLGIISGDEWIEYCGLAVCNALKVTTCGEEVIKM